MTERFDDDELERYARQIVLQELGGVGQDRLRRSRIALVGMGGLGCPAALYLAGAGVGQLTLIDDDAVALGNLHRQILFATADVGQPKVAVAPAALHARTARLAVRTHPGRLTAANAADWLADHDLVVDGSDNFATRRLVADTAAELRLPLLSGAVQGFEGQLTLFTPFASADAPCFHCLFPHAPPPDALPSCAVGGVLGPVAGQVGSMMAAEAVKHLVGIGPSISGTLLLIDGIVARVEHVRLRRRSACDSMAHRATGRAEGERFVGESALATKSGPL